MTIYADQTYLQKHRFASRLIRHPPRPNTQIIVVIPCHNEPDIITTLNSLEGCISPPCEVEVIIVVNASTQHDRMIHDQNQQTVQTINKWKNTANLQFVYHPLYISDLPIKHAGVGLARKIGMDEAVDRFEQGGIDDGLILCLDADSRAAPNYLTEIYQQFHIYPRVEAASIHFEHPTSGTQFSAEVYTGIIWYELYLRYYIEALRFAGYPYAYHTIGSSMAVRSNAYQKQGGMNRRKAGEDFYFLHKFIPNGRFIEIAQTTVFPSPRPSDRVPFGTGKAITDWVDSQQDLSFAYSLGIFEDLHQFITVIPKLYQQDLPHLPVTIDTFLNQEDIDKVLNDIRNNVSNQKRFEKRLYQWFDPLKVLRCVHHATEQFYPKESLLKNAIELYHKLDPSLTSDQKTEILPLKWLKRYRSWQKHNATWKV